MRTSEIFEKMRELERETERISPLVREAFGCCGQPSPQVSARILEEAHRVAAGYRMAHRRQNRRVALTAAAGVLLLLGGAVSLGVREQFRSVPGQDAEIRQATAGQPQEEIGFARVLLDMQGLDEDSFFTDGGTEALWL